MVERLELGEAAIEVEAVDRAMGEKLMRLFQSLNKLGATVLIASHDEALAERVGASVLRLENGQLTQMAATGDAA